MNAKGDANRSVRETKRKLGTALVELLQKKPVQQITVRELTSLAHVSRGTFYFHYTDIYDLMTQMEQEQLSQLNSLMDNLLPRMRQDSPPESLGALFDYLEENHEMCSALYGPHGDPEFWRQIKELIARRCLERLPASTGDPNRRRYLMAFAVDGCLGAITAWFAAQRRPEPEKMRDITWEAIHAVQQLLQEA